MLDRTYIGAIFPHSSWYTTKRFRVDIIETHNHATPIQESQKEREKEIDVIFAGDSYNNVDDDLLAKMIQATKIKHTLRIPLYSDLEEVEDLELNKINPNRGTKLLLDQITVLKPKVVVTMGATTTNILLATREKLSKVHGKFHSVTWGNHTFIIMPIFHPDYLKINPSMKKTAWDDLQELMKHIEEKNAGA